MRFSTISILHCVRFLLAVPLLGLSLACELPSPTAESTQARQSSRKTSGQATTAKDGPFVPPEVTARLTKVRINWKDRQQTFELHLTNASNKLEVVHALVYARNDAINPPRRGISPPTAFNWFDVTNKKDGILTPEDIERAWKSTGFQSGRGGTLRKTWNVKVEPEKTEIVECAHDLDEVSPHPQWKDKKLAPEGYREYEIWLFTPEGRCYFRQSVNSDGTPKPAAKPPETKPAPETKKPETPPVDTRPKETKRVSPSVENQAENELKLAEYLLQQNRRPEALAKLKLIVDKYPGTAAAQKAQDLLKKERT